MAINIRDQRGNPDSLLSWMHRAIRRRKETPEFGWGDLVLFETGDESVMAHGCRWEDSTVVAMHNFSAEPRVVAMDLGSDGDDLILDDLLEDGGLLEAGDGRVELKLDGYGYRWFRIRHAGRPVTP